MKVYLDASAIIYAVESHTQARQSVRGLMRNARDSGGGSLSSLLARLECRVKPLRDQRDDLLAVYERFFAMRSMNLLAITPSIIDRATDLRARYRFKTPDAIHLASEIEHRAERFVTGDADLARCSEIVVEVVSPSEA